MSCMILNTVRTNFDYKRFDTASSSFDVETLGHISRVLAANETALDLVSLHVELSALVSGALAVVDEYDFEVVGTFWSYRSVSEVVMTSQVIPRAPLVISGTLSYSCSLRRLGSR
jgi:hypothetical protein